MGCRWGDRPQFAVVGWSQSTIDNAANVFPNMVVFDIRFAILHRFAAVELTG
jgi:hypothetical protein